jgi:hypothetical protein
MAYSDHARKRDVRVNAEMAGTQTAEIMDRKSASINSYGIKWDFDSTPGVDDWLSNWMDKRITVTGQAQVPAVAATAWRILSSF